VSKKSSKKPKSLLSAQNVILAATGWGVLTLLVFLLGSPIVPRPTWYSVTTYVLENVAMLGAAFLCFRNWRSPQIVSGRIVWLLIGLGMASYFVGNLFLGWWELVWGLAANVSPADVFYLFTYLSLGTGMLMAVVSRRLSLTPGQWGIVAAIAIAGTLLAYFISYAGSGRGEAHRLDPTPTSGVLITSPPESHAPNLRAPLMIAQDEGVPLPAETIKPSVEPSVEPPINEPIESVEPSLSESMPEGVADTDELDPYADSTAPTWIINLERRLDPYADIVGFLYVIGDIFLVVMATMLLLAFWGGRFSLSWRFIAAAAFSFYIADMWFAYAIERFDDYVTGALPEIFWVFSGVLFSIGAALEHDLSTRSRRGIRRRA
jgi:hypothetical protein